MKTVYDANIPYVEEAFSRFGSVRKYPGREISASVLRDADILIVRTVTGVDEALLEGTGVKFVGSATIGCDHVDLDYLERKGIAFAHAAGCNANAVSEYVLAALLKLSGTYGFALKGSALGVIGCGNVGSRVAEKAEIMGMTVLKNDPPLRESTGGTSFSDLDSVLQNADILTLHVPLTGSGKHPTWHLCDDGFFKRVRRGSYFINTSRGSVADTAALHSAIDSGRIAGAVLDVWENEPSIDTGLLEKVVIGTPHIAGYSRDGKLNAVRMVYEAACRFFRIEPGQVRAVLPPPGTPIIKAGGEGKLDEEIIGEIVETAYNIEEDSGKMKVMSSLAEEEKAGYFDALRNEYPLRREFSSMRVSAAGRLLRKISKLGFITETE